MTIRRWIGEWSDHIRRTIGNVSDSRLSGDKEGYATAPLTHPTADVPKLFARVLRDRNREKEEDGRQHVSDKEDKESERGCRSAFQERDWLRNEIIFSRSCGACGKKEETEEEGARTAETLETVWLIEPMVQFSSITSKFENVGSISFLAFLKFKNVSCTP